MVEVRFPADRGCFPARTNTTACAGWRGHALHAVQVLADRHARMVALVHGRAARRRREERPARRGVARVLRLGGRRRRPRVGPRLELVQPALWPWLACVWARQLLAVAASARRAWACLSCRIHSVESGQGRATCLDPGSGSSRSCTGHAWCSPALHLGCNSRQHPPGARAPVRDGGGGAGRGQHARARRVQARRKRGALRHAQRVGGRARLPPHRVLPQVVVALHALLLGAAAAMGLGIG